MLDMHDYSPAGILIAPCPDFLAIAELRTMIMDSSSRIVAKTVHDHERYRNLDCKIMQSRRPHMPLLGLTRAAYAAAHDFCFQLTASVPPQMPWLSYRCATVESWLSGRSARSLSRPSSMPRSPRPLRLPG